MSIELATGYVNIVSSAKGLGKSITREITGVDRTANAAGDAAGKRFGSGFVATAGKLVGGLLAIKGIGKGFQFAKGAVFDFNSQLEQADIGFSTMLGSGQKSQVFLDQLQKFAKSTPFEFTGLVSNAQTMMGMGVAAKNVIPYLTALGDSTASVGGDGEKLNQTILAFSQTMAKGTLDMGNMNQLLQGGVPNALKILAAQYGVTTGEMVKMISAGKVQSAEALPKLIEGIEKGTKATAALGGMMDRQSQTMAGALGNIGDSATQLIAGAFKPLFSVTSSGLQKLADALGSDAVQKWADRTSAGITRAITVTKGAVEVIRTGDFNPKNWPGFEEDSPVVGFFFHIRDAVKVATGALGKMKPVFAGFKNSAANAFGLASEAAMDFWAGINMTAADRKEFAQSIDDLPFMRIGAKMRAGMESASAAVRKASPGIRRYLADTFSLPPSATKSWSAFASAGLGKAKDSIVSFGKDAWGGIQSFLDAARPGFEKLWGAIQPLIKELGPSLKTILPILNPFKFLFEALRPMLPQIGQALGQIASTVGSFLASALRSAQPLFEAIVSAVAKLMPFVQKLVAALLPPLVSLFDKIAPLLDAIFKALEPVVSAIADGLTKAIEFLEPIIERVFSFFADQVKAVMKIVGGVIDFITGIFTGNWSKAWNGIKEIFGGIWDGIKNIAKLAIDWFGKIPGWIWDKIKAFAGWLFDRGADFLTWIWNGIKSVVGGVLQWFADLPGKAWAGIRALVKTINGWGSDLLNWIWDGIKSAAKAVWDWFAGIGDKIWNGIKTAASAITGFGGKIIGWIGDGIGNAVDAALSFFANLATWIWNKITGLFDLGVQIMQEVARGMASVISSNPVFGLLGGAGAGGAAAAVAAGTSGKGGGGFGGGGMFAKGTNALPDGYSIINELGPELLYKQGPNVKVMTAGKTQQVMGGRDAPLIGEVNVYESMSPDRLAGELSRQIMFHAPVMAG